MKYTVDGTSGASISGGPLPADTAYNLAQLHLHWGDKRGQGSEHTVNGMRYLKCNMVFIDIDYLMFTATALPAVEKIVLRTSQKLPRTSRY